MHGHRSANRCGSDAPGRGPRALAAGPQRGEESPAPTPPQLTLYTSPALSRYRLMAAFWYTRQKPFWPHRSCQSRQALSITQPKAMGPGMPPAERGHSEPSVLAGGGARTGDAGHWRSQGSNGDLHVPPLGPRHRAG